MCRLLYTYPYPPVYSFGDPTNKTIILIGLNPSSQEFKKGFLSDSSDLEKRRKSQLDYFQGNVYSYFNKARSFFDKDVKIIFVGFDANAPAIYEMIIEDIDVPTNKKYGEDYVMLGYIPGLEIGAAAYAKDIHALISVDTYGTPLEELPLMQNVRNIEDIDLAISISSGFGPMGYINQFYIPYGTPVAAGCIGIMAPGLRPYYPDQLRGFLPTARNGAEYELLINEPGIGIIDFDAQTLAHLVLIIFIITGNIFEYSRVFERKTEGET